VSGYRNGSELERAAKHALEDDGYYVIKSGGSKGIVDLAAFKPGETLFVQCKLTGYLSPAERVKFLRLAETLRTVPLVGLWVKTGRDARRVGFMRLTGTGPRDWSPDYGLNRVPAYVTEGI